MAAAWRCPLEGQAGLVTRRSRRVGRRVDAAAEEVDAGEEEAGGDPGDARVSHKPRVTANRIDERSKMGFPGLLNTACFAFVFLFFFFPCSFWGGSHAFCHVSAYIAMHPVPCWTSFPGFPPPWPERRRLRDGTRMERQPTADPNGSLTCCLLGTQSGAMVMQLWRQPAPCFPRRRPSPSRQRARSCVALSRAAESEPSTCRALARSPSQHNIVFAMPTYMHISPFRGHRLQGQHSTQTLSLPQPIQEPIQVANHSSGEKPRLDPSSPDPQRSQNNPPPPPPPPPPPSSSMCARMS